MMAYAKSIRVHLSESVYKYRRHNLIKINKNIDTSMAKLFASENLAKSMGYTAINFFGILIGIPIEINFDF
jgi:hypothetical protein